jgi:hypothetical protein
VDQVCFAATFICTGRLLHRVFREVHVVRIRQLSLVQGSSVRHRPVKWIHNHIHHLLLEIIFLYEVEQNEYAGKSPHDQKGKIDLKNSVKYSKDVLV